MPAILKALVVVAAAVAAPTVSAFVPCAANASVTHINYPLQPSCPALEPKFNLESKYEDRCPMYETKHVRFGNVTTVFHRAWGWMEPTLPADHDIN
jgi:hypothetical protein